MSFWEGLFSGAMSMLVSGSVDDVQFLQTLLPRYFRVDDFSLSPGRKTRTHLYIYIYYMICISDDTTPHQLFCPCWVLSGRVSVVNALWSPRAYQISSCLEKPRMRKEDRPWHQPWLLGFIGELWDKLSPRDSGWYEMPTSQEASIIKYGHCAPQMFVYSIYIYPVI